MKKFALLLVLGLLCLPVSQSRAQDAVAVRAGVHPQYNRLVMDWTQKVDYDMSRQGNQVTLQFNRKSNAQLRQALATRTPFIRNLAQEENDKGLVLRFDIPDGAQLATSRSGTKTVFDVKLASNTAPRFTQAAPASAPAPAQEVKPPETKADDTPAKPVPAETKTESVVKTSDAPAAPPEQQESKAKILPPPPAITQTPDTPRLRTLADQLAEMTDRQARAATETTTETTALKPKDAVEGTVIRLDPKEFTKLAVFEHAGKLWLVLDKALKTFMPEIEGDLLEHFSKNARRIDHPRATAFVFDVPQGDVRYSVRREKNQWQIWLDNKDKVYLPEDMPVNVVPNTEKTKTHLALYAGEEPTILQMRDSTTGERLWIIPVRTPEGRIVQPRMAPGYRVLPTYMGAMIVLDDDNLTLAPSRDMVLIYPNDGKDMLLSSPEDRKKGLAEARYLPLFRLDLPAVQAKSFIRQRQELQAMLVQAEEPAKQADILMDLARLYVGQGFGQEALGLLRMAVATHPMVENENAFHALRGMAAAMAGDVQQAEQDLKIDALHSQPASKLWLGYAFGRQGQWQAAHNAFLESGASEDSFPESLQPRLILAKAEANLFVSDPVRTSRQLQKITAPDTLTPSEKAGYQYMQASLDVLLDRGDRALPVYQELAEGNDRLYAAKAQLAFIRQSVTAGTMPLKDAIEGLERLRYSWRGDRLEIDILRQLGQYYLDNKQFGEGLTVWRQAASLAKNSDDIDAITQAMQNTFKRLYVEGEAKDMQPLQAVALFERFRELIPAGDLGNVALSNLADRLAAVDLLDQADALLSKQLAQQNDPEQVSATGAKLARWRLLNGEPQSALAVLDKTASEEIVSDTMSQQRLLLRARALADVGQVDESLALLRTSRSDEALSLQADINWRQNRWGEALEAMQSLAVSYRNQGKTDVDGVLPSLILKMAIALTLDGNIKGMELLKAQYGDYMATTPKANVFTAMIQPIGAGGLADRETLKAQVGDVELFQQFLKGNPPQ